ncbi:hypothetical protein COU61_03620, partial [Candidatus Pacearchaeota archaeon CG10_big_fil_rev_8_21_14_0_10_35_13]
MVKKSSSVILPKGSLRISKGLVVYSFNDRWVKTSKKLVNVFPSALKVIELFNSNDNLQALVDPKDSHFLKGILFPGGLVRGARINILPDGKLLDKAYSLFSPDLTIHDESSTGHWDVLYRNPNGKFAYVYALDKRNSSFSKKFSKVHVFEEKYPLLLMNVLNALNGHDDSMAVPMLTLLKTFMGVGNEVYFNAHGHKGLTTLKKSDIAIKNNSVRFSFIAKSGVPMVITEGFPKIYVIRLRALLSKKKSSDFVFVDKNNHPLRDSEFMKAFVRYCGVRFYPHIVRFFYATSKAEEFLNSLKNGEKVSKKQVKELYTSIASKLGHRSFSKKNNLWKDNPNVTIHY